MGIQDKVRRLISKKPEYKGILNRIVEHEQKNLAEFQKEEERRRNIGLTLRKGFSYDEVGVQPTRLTHLVSNGILEKPFSTNSRTEYRLVDFKGTKEAIDNIDSVKRAKTKIPPASRGVLFDDIYGYEDIKELFRAALFGEKPIHLLLTGPPSTAKSLFVEEIAEKFPEDSEYVDGANFSSSELQRVIAEEQPKYVLIDEIDKNKNKKEFGVMANIMETGRVKRLKRDFVYDRRLDVRVFATANVNNLPDYLKSRFTPLEFPAYNQEAFMRVCVHYLTAKEGTHPEDADKIAKVTWSDFGADVRNARAIARFAETMELDKVVEIMEKYGS